jgi:membrane protease YdiL (CAAX protease family)
MPVAGTAAWSRGERAAAVAVSIAGVALLLARPYAMVTGRVALFALSYVVIGTASIAVPAERGRPSTAPAAALALGLAALAVAALVGGSPVPWPASAWALPLSTLAAVAEEALFRRTAFAWLSRFGPVVAVVASAGLFAAVHAPAYGLAAVPVDLGAGLVFGWQRWASGTWTVPAATHAAANVLAVLG